MVLRIVPGALCAAMAVVRLPPDARGPGPVWAGRRSHRDALAVIAGEVVCGIWFLTCPRSKVLASVRVYTAVWVIWSVPMVQAFARGVAVADCVDALFTRVCCCAPPGPGPTRRGSHCRGAAHDHHMEMR